MISLAKEYQKLKHLAELDELTQLGNRRFFEKQLQHYWKILSDTQ